MGFNKGIRSAHKATRSSAKAAAVQREEMGVRESSSFSAAGRTDGESDISSKSAKSFFF